MAVGARELMLILRVRDEASRVLKGATGEIDGMSKASKKAADKHIEQGKALVGIGSGIAVVGAIGLGWLNSSIDAAAAYNTQVAYTKTQTDKVQVSLQELSKIGTDLARTIPVPFEEIQGGLYDIFSSMDVTVPQAKNLLTEFSKAAVAGQTDLQTASKGTISILNAWKLPASEVNRVNDVMFRLVQKGVGTYTQFSQSIGRAIPSTVRAGGSIEDLAGMMAFMTRNGLSTSQAATSAARAFDAMSNPTTEKHMKKLGLTTRDAHGEFKPMSQIVEELNGKLKGMTAPERANAMKELFLGSGGTIQARRFFDLAIPGFKELNTRTKEMHDSAGTMEGAYKTMFDAPQSKMQLMTNKYEAMRVEIGNNLLPIKLKLMEIINKLLDAWNNLSPGTQKFIAIAALVVVVLTILVGVLLIIVGGILMLMGAAALAGVTLGGVVAVVLAVIAVIVGLSLLVWEVIKNWSSITKFFSDLWDDVSRAFSNAYRNTMETLGRWWNDVSNFFQNLWRNISTTTSNWWNSIIRFLQSIPGAISNAFSSLMGNIGSFFSNLWRGVSSNTSNGWNNIIRYLQGIPGAIMSAVSSLAGSIGRWASSIATGAWNGIVNGFNSVIQWFRNLPNMILGAIPSPGSILYNAGQWIIQGLINGISSQVGNLRGYLGNITGWISSWKGPPSVDKKILFNAGQLTMRGYQDGIRSSLPDVRSTLQDFTRSIPSVVSGPDRGAGTGGGVQQNFYITTQEIDPRKHAADLGAMVAKRLG